MTKRQKEVWGMIAQGLPNLAIAATLNIQLKTVKSHCTEVFKVLGVKNRTQAAIEFHRQVGAP